MDCAEPDRARIEVGLGNRHRVRCDISALRFRHIKGHDLVDGIATDLAQRHGRLELPR